MVRVFPRSVLNASEECHFTGFRCYPQGSSLPNIAVASGNFTFPCAHSLNSEAYNCNVGIGLVLLVETIAYIESKHGNVCGLEFL